MSGYQPIDVQLASLRIRVLRALRWREWASSEDLAVALDAFGSGDRFHMHTILRRAVLDQHAEARGERMHTRYRITSAGRAEIEAINARAQIGLVDDDSKSRRPAIVSTVERLLVDGLGIDDIAARIGIERDRVRIVAARLRRARRAV